MTIKVTKTANTYSVKLNNTTNNFKVSLSGEVSSVAGSLSNLDDFDPTGVQNGFVVMYNSATRKYITVDPDIVLSGSVTGGLPQTFVDELDSNLDNKIDLDAGTF